MVYCGKPSKGCSHCRKRKIRCDQGVPACSQCIKAEKGCPGYRNMLDLAFRNESDDVIRKAKTKSRKSPSKSKEVSPAPRKAPHCAASEPTDPTSSVVVLSSSNPVNGFQSFPTIFSDDLDGLETTSNISSLSLCIQPTIEETGFNCFIFNFVKLPDGPSHGYFYYINDLSQTGALDDTLHAAITAAGLASLATRSKSSPLMARARRRYAIALRKINAALRSPVECLKDSILLSIIVVAVFETIAGAKELSLKEWTEHIHGAATLVKLRGRDQLKSPGSRGLFMHATSHVMLSCVQREVAMPSQILELHSEAFYYLPMDPAYRFIQLADQMTVFRGALQSGAFKDPEAVITRALTIDNKFVECFINVSYDWMYETVFTDINCEAVFEGSYDVYYDHWVAQIWNAMRSQRIMLHETIRSQLIKGFKSTPRQFTLDYFQTRHQASANICMQMRDAIFRSVPQHLGFITRKPFTSAYDSTTSSPPYIPDLFSELEPTASPFQAFDSTTSFTDFLHDSTSIPFTPQKETLHQDPTHPSIGGCFLLWPIYVAGITRVSNITHKTFVANTLQYVGETIGIRAASNLATFMRENSMGDESTKGTGRMGEDAMVDEKPKGPLKEMLRREERERIERLRIGRGEAYEQVS